MKNDPYAWTNQSNNPELASVRTKLHEQAEALVGEKLGVFFKRDSYELR